MKNQALLLGAAFALSCVALLPSHSQGSLSPATAFGSTSISPGVASLGSECASPGNVPVPARTIIEIGDLCKPSSWGASPAPAAACPGQSAAVLGIRFRGRQDLVLAEHLTLDRQSFHVRLWGPLEDAHGNSQDIASIERVEWCRGSAIPDTVDLPGGGCREPRQFAAAFDYGTPLSNKILTNGFSFYVRMSGQPPADFEVDKAADEVLSSFGRALTMWTASLQDNDALVTPAIRAFVKSRTSSSGGGYVLLTPPQVVRLRCPHAATFVVELNFGGDGIFPANSLFLTLAKARVEGRTIALNLRDVPCFRTMTTVAAGQLSLRDEYCVNLPPVLMHELGHAFGLDHIESEGGRALMNPVLSDRATMPVQQDVIERQFL